MALRSLIALLLVAFVVPATALADNLLEIFQLAQQRDPHYAAAQAAQKADQEVVPQARAQLLPHISAQMRAETSDIRKAAGLSHRGSSKEAAWALALSQPVIDIGSWDLYKQSQFMAESASIATRQAYQNLILRVAQAYFDVLTVNDTIRALEAQKSAAQSQLERAKKAFELGSATVTDIYETQARLDLIHANGIQARARLDSTLDELEKITGQRPQQLARLKPDAVLPSPEPNRLSDWTEQASSANFSTIRALLATRIVEKQIDVAKSGHYPRLDLYAQTGSASNRGVYGPGTQPRSLDSTVGLQLSIPIFAGGEISSRVREQTSRLQQARYEYEAARRLAIQETQLHFAGVTSGLAQIKVLQAAEKSSLDSLQANQTAYDIGVRDNMDVLDAQQQVYETQRDLAHAHYATVLSGLYLKASSGILTEDDVAAINSLLEP